MGHRWSWDIVLEHFAHEGTKKFQAASKKWIKDSTMDEIGETNPDELHSLYIESLQEMLQPQWTEGALDLLKGREIGAITREQNQRLVTEYAVSFTRIYPEYVKKQYQTYSFARKQVQLKHFKQQTDHSLEDEGEEDEEEETALFHVQDEERKLLEDGLREEFDERLMMVNETCKFLLKYSDRVAAEAWELLEKDSSGRVTRDQLQKTYQSVIAEASEKVFSREYKYQKRLALFVHNSHSSLNAFQTLIKSSKWKLDHDHLLLIYVVQLPSKNKAATDEDKKRDEGVKQNARTFLTNLLKHCARRHIHHVEAMSIYRTNEEFLEENFDFLTKENISIAFIGAQIGQALGPFASHIMKSAPCHVVILRNHVQTKQAKPKAKKPS